MTLGENIRKLRLEKGFSIMKIRELTGLSKSTISDLENDKSSPTVETLQKIAEALGVSVEDFFKSKPVTEETFKKCDEEYDSKKLSEEIKLLESKKITDVKQAMEVILSQPGLMLNGEMLSDESKIALANAIQMGLAYAEQMQKKEKEKNKK